VILRENNKLCMRGIVWIFNLEYSEKTKEGLVTNEKALTSWSNRSNEFLTTAGFDDSKRRNANLGNIHEYIGHDGVLNVFLN